MAQKGLVGLFDTSPTIDMQYVRLGSSGLKVSRIILGAMSYGSKQWADWVLDEDEALPLLEHAYKAGINTWDTADIYSDGRSEEIIAKALSTYQIPRENVVILTKCRFGTSVAGEPMLPLLGTRDSRGVRSNRVGLSRKHIFDAVERSVAKLGTYIDVLQIHRMDPDVPYEEIMRALNDVVEKGWVRYLGASSMPAWEFQMLQNTAEKHGWHKFVSMQNYYNLLYREEEREMIPYCKRTGVGLIPWSPNARGLLTRPWTSGGASKTSEESKTSERSKSSEESKKSEENKTNGQSSAGTSLRAGTDLVISRLYSKHDEEANAKVIDVVEKIANERGVSMAIISIAWCLSKGVEPIVGLNKKERIDEAVQAVKLHLTAEEIERLEAVYVPRAQLDI